MSLEIVNLNPFEQQGPLRKDSLELTFSFLSAEDLKLVEVVCKFWNQVADDVVSKPLSVAEGVRRVFCINPRFLAEPAEDHDAFLEGVLRGGGLGPGAGGIKVFQRVLTGRSLQSMQWGRTPGTIITVNQPLSYRQDGTLTYPNAEVRQFNLRKGTERVETLQAFAEKCGRATWKKTEIFNQEHYLTCFGLWNFVLVLLNSKVLRIYDKRQEYKILCETPPITDIAHENRGMLFAQPYCNESLMVVPCKKGILRVFDVKSGTFLHTLPVDWGTEREEDRFFTKLRINDEYTIAGLSTGTINVFKDKKLFRSFGHEGHFVTDFGFGKKTIVALFCPFTMHDNTLPTTLKVWDLETEECLSEKVYQEGPMQLEYSEYKRLICECHNGQILVLDPFNVLEAPTLGRQVVNFFSCVWNALCTFARWIASCFD